MRHRNDIQILRGLAVILVVFFHLEVPGFSSGFLGVDVFFVISGYLMAVMYDPLKKQEFFAKRARRLLPAYFSTVLLTLLVAIFITTPNDFWQVSNQALFAAIFAPNIGYWLDNSYFDKASFKPLLHLWSLGVEIQFYLLIPMFYWIFRRQRSGFSLLYLSSVVLCFLVVGISPKTAFFWLPLRLWEFLTGFGIAYYISKQQIQLPKKAEWIGATALLVIICVPMFKVDGTVAGFMLGHPGIVALLVVFATAVTLAFGLPLAVSKNPIAALFERIGDYSYSIYLAHFPIIVMFLYQPFAGTMLKTEGLTQSIALSLLVIFTSTLLYKYVEVPFRAIRFGPGFALASIGTVLAVSQVGLAVQNAMTPEKEMRIYQAWSDRDGYRCGKLNRILNPKGLSCEVTKPIDVPRHRILLVGNSHADSIKTTFSESAYANNTAVFFWVDNDPLLKGGAGPGVLIAEAILRKADVIVLHFSPNSIDSQVISKLALLTRENHIRLSFIMPVPTWERHVPMVLWKNLKHMEAIPSNSFADYQQFNRHLIDGIAKIDVDKFRIYQVAEVFCRSNCILASQSGDPLYFDSGHLTLTGSRMLRDVFDKVIADLS